MRILALLALSLLLGCEPTHPENPGGHDSGTTPDAGVTSDAGVTPDAGTTQPDAGCTSEPDSTFCARLDKNCGFVTDTDNCGVRRTTHCGSCAEPHTCGGGGVANVCGSGACQPETDAAFCTRLGKQCGNVMAVDNCGAERTAFCGGCTAPQTCGGGGQANVCGCTPESAEALCSARGKNCGQLSVRDSCGNSRTVSCGSCTAPQTCGGGGQANVCACAPETNAAFCTRLGKQCGTVSGTDNCGRTRTVSSCGTCTSPKTCGGGGQANVCGCVPTPETDEQVCQRLGKTCGTLWATDSCGNSRMVQSCGSCTAPETCGGGGTGNVCGCTPETDAAFCSARGANCGQVSGVDRCGRSRTVTCGGCDAPRTCGGSGTANLCTLPLGDYPGVAMTKLSSDQPLAFFLSPDEQHVAYSTNRSDSPYGCFGRIGLGELVVLTPGATPLVQRVESQAGFNESFFTSDSAHLIYTRYSTTDPCVSSTSLYSAKADGTGRSLMASAGYFKNIQQVGASVLYKEMSYSANDPGYLHAYSFVTRQTEYLGRDAGRSGLELAPQGNAVLYDNDKGVWTIQKLTPYSLNGVPLLAESQKYLYGRAWSPDSTRLAFIHAAATDAPRTLSLISHDGTGRQELIPDCQCQQVFFTPDGTRIAYDGQDASGTQQIHLRSLVGGDTVTLTGLPSEGDGRFAFSPDGRWVRAEMPSSTSTYSYPRLFLANTTQSGAFVELTSNYAYGFTPTQDWDYVAALIDQSYYERNVTVFPTAGGTARVPVASGINWMDYEHVASTPRLAVLYQPSGVYDLGTLGFFATDGSGPAQIVTTEAYVSGTGWSIARPFWAGRVVLYSVNRRQDPVSGERVFDLAATTSDGTTLGLVARDVLQLRFVNNPTRVFFTRSQRSGGGLWMVELPR